MNNALEIDSVQLRLARLVQAVRFEDLPPDVVRYTKVLILDSIGCLIGGLDSAPAGIARNLVEGLGGKPVATVVGAGLKTSPALAAFANGTALRYQDFNDAYGARDAAHPSGNLPVALAVAEAEKLSGRDMIAGLVAAYEVHVRLCDSAGEPSLKQRGWHHTCNLQFAATALAARLLTDDPAIIANALAISATHQNTLSQIQHGDISMIKATADAWVAKGAVEAAMLAKGGLTGPDEIFEGQAGWTAGVAGTVDYDRLLAPLGGTFGIMQARIKSFAVVGPAQAPVQAAVDMRDDGIAPDGIERLIVLLPERVVNDPAVDGKRFPTNRETADHSFHYTAAIALLEGACGEAQYAPEKIASPAVRALLEKTTLEADPEFSRGHRGGGGIRTILRDGQTVEKRYAIPPGHPENPLTDVQLARKFDQLTEPVFTAERGKAIKRAVLELETCADVSALCRLLA